MFARQIAILNLLCIVRINKSDKFDHAFIIINISRKRRQNLTLKISLTIKYPRYYIKIIKY